MIDLYYSNIPKFNNRAKIHRQPNEVIQLEAVARFRVYVINLS